METMTDLNYKKAKETIERLGDPSDPKIDWVVDRAAWEAHGYLQCHAQAERVLVIALQNISDVSHSKSNWYRAEARKALSEWRSLGEGK